MVAAEETIKLMGDEDPGSPGSLTSAVEEHLQLKGIHELQFVKGPIRAFQEIRGILTEVEAESPGSPQDHIPMVISSH